MSYGTYEFKIFKNFSNLRSLKVYRSGFLYFIIFSLKPFKYLIELVFLFWVLLKSSFSAFLKSSSVFPYLLANLYVCCFLLSPSLSHFPLSLSLSLSLTLSLLISLNVPGYLSLYLSINISLFLQLLKLRSISQHKID